MKPFKIIWGDGKVEYIWGETISDAFIRAGYTGGALTALDFYDDNITELPLEHKRLIDEDGDEISKYTRLGSMAWGALLMGETYLCLNLIGKKTHYYKTEIGPFTIKIWRDENDG